ncbi:MAG: hypothetical protein AB8H86_11690 [Polyangiales bacterium]
MRTAQPALARTLGVALLAALLQWMPSVASAAPLLPLRGLLADSEGEPIDGSVSVTFSLYAELEAEGPEWTESRMVSFSAGRMSVYLGDLPTNPLDLSLFRDSPDVHLGIRIADDEEFERVPLGTTAYAAFATFCGEASELEASARTALVGDSVAAAATAFGDTLGGLSCANGESALFVDDAWSCEAPVTDVTAEAGLSGGGSGGGVSLSVDTSYVQRRISSTCAAGSFIQAVAEDGTVTCGAMTGTGAVNVSGAQVAFRPTVSGPFEVVGVSENFGQLFARTMTPVASSICYLTRVRVMEDNDEDDVVQCEIVPDSGRWSLQLRASGDDIPSIPSSCQARCLNF